MEMIGSVSDNCEFTNIYDKGFVREISVYFGEIGVAALHMKISNAREYHYGKQDTKGLYKRQFDFKDGH